MTHFVHLNGHLVKSEDARISVFDRAVMFAKAAPWLRSKACRCLRGTSRRSGQCRFIGNGCAKGHGLGRTCRRRRSTYQELHHGFENFPFEHPMEGGADHERIVHEPIGVCSLIIPWNWLLNQLTLKAVPAMLVGCTVVLKPSEIAPLSSMIFAEIVDEAGLPAGVFNLVNGDGAGVGSHLSSHAEVDMVSFTGSTREGGRWGLEEFMEVKHITGLSA